MFDAAKLEAENGTSATVSLKNWMILDCINFLNIIPIIGSIAAIVIYCVIGFGNTAAPSMRNRIIASIIWACIFIVLGIVLMMTGAFASLALMAYQG